MRSPTRASELVTDVQEASLPPVREEDRHRPRGAAGRLRPKVLTADIRASSERHLAGRLTTTRIEGRGGTVRPCSHAYSWYYDQYERRRLPPARGDHRRRSATPLDRRGEGLDRGREPRPGDDGLGGGAPLRAAPEPAVRLAPATRGTGSTRRARVHAGSGRGGRPGTGRGGGPDRDRARPGRRPCRRGRRRGGAAPGARGAAGAGVIAVPPGVRILLAARPVDFRKGMDGLAALVQQALRADPFAGDVFIFRPRRGDRVKILVFDGTGLVLVTKRLEAGRFCWPSPAEGAVRLSAAQLATLLEGLPWHRLQPRAIPRPSTAW